MDRRARAARRVDEDEVRRVFRLPVRRLLPALAIAAVVGSAAFVYLSAMDARFTAQTDIVLTPTTEAFTSSDTEPADLQTLTTQAAVMTAREAVADAIERAGTQDARVQISAEVPSEAAISSLSVEADSRAAASRTADALADLYISEVNDRVQAVSRGRLEALDARHEQLRSSLEDVGAQLASEQGRLEANAVARGLNSAGTSALLQNLQTRYRDLSTQEAMLQQDITEATEQQAREVPVRQLNQAQVVGSTQRGLITRFGLAAATGLIAAMAILWLVDVTRRTLLGDTTAAPVGDASVERGPLEHPHAS